MNPDDADLFPALPADIKARIERLRARTPNETQQQHPTKPKLNRDEISTAEHRVLEQIAAGLSNAEAALVCVVSIETVKSHVAKMLKRCQCSNRAQLTYRYGRGDLTVVELNRIHPRHDDGQ